MEPIGTVRSPYAETSQIPKGMGAVHQAEGILELLPAYEAGLTDIEVSLISMFSGCSTTPLATIYWAHRRLTSGRMACSPRVLRDARIQSG